MLAVACLCALGTARSARAQQPGDLRDALADLLRELGELAVQAGDRTRGEVFSFLERIELYDVEGEIDRLVGNPWQLSDSTDYKLGLYPLHVAYPVYQQLLRQMTRLDDLRSQRIQNVTPDAVDIIAVRLDILDDRRTGRQFLDSATKYFDAREVLDLGVFALAHQPLFPEDQIGWDRVKRRLARRKGLVVATLLPLAALSEAGALSRSGTLRRWPDNLYRLGWYGGFRRLGFRLHPYLRGGLTAHLPGLEMAAGVSEQIRPDPGTAQRALEFALRESWLGRLTGPTGWDSFVEAAARRVLASSDGYAGEWLTARAGVFVKRVRPLLIPNLVVRSSAEIESDLEENVRFALGLGLDHTSSGLSAVLQSSRSNAIEDGRRIHDTRTGLFLAGTMEPPTQHYVEAMHVQARLLGEAWQAWLEGEARRQAVEARTRVAASVRPSSAGPAMGELARATAEAETLRVRLAVLLPRYLESRRMAYSLRRWPRSPGDLHGPLDGAALRQVVRVVYDRLYELADFLERAPAALEPLRAGLLDTREAGRAAGAMPVQLVSLEPRTEALGRAWREESDQATGAMRLYSVYRDSARRIATAASLPGLRRADPLSLSAKRKLITLCAQPLAEIGSSAEDGR
jgi:hypothetical protein